MAERLSCLRPQNTLAVAFHAAAIAVVLAAALAMPSRSHAGDGAAGPQVELVMVEARGCAWCIHWHKQIGPAYPKTEQGQRAPLKRIDIRDVASLGLSLSSPVTTPPTFVLVENGREIGRIVGHPGDEFFWGLLDELLQKLPPEPRKSPEHGEAAGLRDAILPVGQAAQHNAGGRDVPPGRNGS